MTIYKMHGDLIAMFKSLQDELDVANDRRAAIQLAEQLIRLAERLVTEAPDEADAYQMLGLAWYNFPRQTPWRSWHCRAALERALEIDANHLWARK